MGDINIEEHGRIFTSIHFNHLRYLLPDIMCWWDVQHCLFVFFFVFFSGSLLYVNLFVSFHIHTTLFSTFISTLSSGIYLERVFKFYSVFISDDLCLLQGFRTVFFNFLLLILDTQSNRFLKPVRFN